VTTGIEYLAIVDDIAPGLVVGAHVVGSAVLGDYVADGSDLDLVCELSGPPDLPTLADTLPGDLDVIFVRSGELAKRVRDARTVAWGRDGILHTNDQGGLVPVLWEQLRAYGETLRGPVPSPPVTREEVAQYCRENLESYWAPLLEQVRAGLTEEDNGTLGPRLRWAARCRPDAANPRSGVGLAAR
jgi:hypothetical protein